MPSKCNRDLPDHAAINAGPPAAWQTLCFRRHIPHLFATHLLAALLLVGLTWPHDNNRFILAWGAVFALAWAGASFAVRHCAAASPATDTPARVLHIEYAAPLVWSSPWIVAGEMFMQVDFAMRIVAVGTLLLLAAATIVFSEASFPAMATSLLCILLPGALYLLSSQDRFDIPLGLVLLAFLILHLASARHAARAALEHARQSLRSERTLASLRAQLDAQADACERMAQGLCHARQACLDKSRFLAAASHDLRQPMHAISLFVAALKSEAFDSRSRHLLERLDRSLAGLDDLFNRLLDISRLDAGLITPGVKTIDAATVAQTLESRFLPVAASKSLVFRTHCRPGLYLRSDPELLVELITNLLSNAFRYTERGGVLLTFRARGDQVLIQIWDTGCGIPDHYRELIFDEFVQLDNPARDRRKGLGLGLAIVKRLSDALRHPVTVCSQVGRGSTFGLHVPVAQDVGLMQVEAAHCPMPRSAVDGALVLIVDDEIDILAAMEAILASWGCHAILARSAEEARKYVDASLRFPDVIITDHRLDNKQTSFDVVAAIQPLLPYEIPVVVISGEARAALEREIDAMGWLFMNKPVTAVRLHAALGRALERTMQSFDKVA